MESLTIPQLNDANIISEAPPPSDSNEIAAKQQVQEEQTQPQSKEKSETSLVSITLQSKTLATRENRDMSEGLQNSRSQKLGLVTMEDTAGDIHSQINFGASKLQSQINTTLDSGGLQTASGEATKATTSKLDTTNLSGSKLNYKQGSGAAPPKKSYTLSAIPKAMVHVSSSESNRSQSMLYTPLNKPYHGNKELLSSPGGTRCYKKLELIINQVKMQISSRIDL